MNTFTSLEDLSVEIVNPAETSEQNFSDNSILFRGQIIGDSDTDYSDLTARWSSQYDNVIHQSKLNSQGESSFTHDALSLNLHNIKLEIINEVDSVITDSINVFNAIRLNPIEKNNSSLNLSWETFDDEQFISYDIYRSFSDSNMMLGDPIHTILDIRQTTFNDTTAIIGEKYYYQIRMNRNSNENPFFDSNIRDVVAGKTIKTNYPILKLIKDEQRNFAYGIVNTESIWSDNRTGYGFIFIDLEEFEIEKRILTSVRFSDLDIDPSGNYLYLASRSTTIHRIDLNTKQLETTLTLNRSAHKLEVGSGGRLYYHRTPPTSGGTQFGMYDLETNSNLPYVTTMNYDFFRHGDFEIDENDIIYHGGSNSSNSRLSKIGTSNDAFSLLNQWDSRNYQSARIVINNNKIYWNHFILDTNLNIMGTFQNENGDVNIKDVSPNGDYALGWRSVWETSNQTKVKEIPADFDLGIFSTDSQVILSKTDSPLSEEYESLIIQYDFR
ncbi:hypothetical protein BST97_04305 [Nonlabens spongiae]|uniref:Fibronectin type-III domain-containing protein n=2 Tax=Nonlabens spongiae TaxID=331648 RepID=A0A1W6MI20_9FLAO|nr:hypothetical protein BST97_04305 [Nonlabens spongiae]